MLNNVKESDVPLDFCGAVVRLTRTLSSHTSKSKWSEFTRIFSSLFAADGCAMLIVDPLNPVDFAGCINRAKFELSLRQRLLKQLATQPDSVWIGDQSIFNEVLSEVESKLFSNARSTLWCVLRSDEGAVTGVVIAARDWDDDHPRTPFAQAERQLLQQLVPIVESMVESLHASLIVERLLYRINNCGDRTTALIEVSRYASALLNAGATSIYQWDSSASTLHCLVRDSVVPDSNSALVPNDSEKNLHYANGDFNLTGTTASAVIRSDDQQEKIGMIEIRSKGDSVITSFQLEKLRSFVKDVPFQEFFRKPSMNAANTSSEDPYSIAENLLVRLQRELDCAGGIVYRSIPRTDCLLGFCGKCTSGKDFLSNPYIFKVTDNAAATYAFLNGTIFSSTPRSDNRVSLKGCLEFDISGPMAAVQLSCGNTLPFGSVVVWWANRLGEAEEIRLSELQVLVDQFAPRLKMALSPDDEIKRSEIQKQFSLCSQQMAREADLNQNLRAILDGIEACGFSRVRLYEFHFGDTLIGKASRGMGNKSFQFADAGDERIRFRITDNYYTNSVFQSVCNARNGRGTSQEQNLSARFFPNPLEVESNGEAKPDVGVESIGKPPGMPWVDVPIVSRGKLYGLIAADKLTNLTREDGSKVWRQITDLDLDLLDDFAQLACRAYSMEESRGMLNGESLRTLEPFLGVGQQLDLVFRRLLLFLTHGEQGLGFNRALVYRLDDHNQDRLVLAGAVGSTSHTQHMQIIGDVHEKHLEWILRDARLSHDLPLAEEIKSVSGAEFLLEESIFATNPVRKYSCTENDRPKFIEALQDQFGWKDILVSRTCAENRTFGYFVVDRAWDEYGVDQNDNETLASFSRHAAHELLQHFRLKERLEDVERTAKAIIHEIRLPQGTVQRHVDLLSNSPYFPPILRPTLRTIRGENREISKIITTLEEMFVEDNPVETTSIDDCENIFSELGCLPEFATRNRILLELQGQLDGVLVVIGKSRLHLVFKNLLSNAVEAASRSVGGQVLAIASAEGDFVTFVLQNDGQVLSKEAVAELEQPFPKSTKAEKEFGFGLFLVRWVVAKAGGTIQFDPISKGGLKVVVQFPCLKKDIAR